MAVADDLRPPIPVTCAARPVIGGLAAPYINAHLADGGVDFRTPHTARYEKCLSKDLCQTCAGPLGSRAVFFGGPNQLRGRHFDEPALCPPCANYASRACPMVAGRVPVYATAPKVSDGKRGKTCFEPGCDCGGWVHTDAGAQEHGGEPAHAWYAVWMPRGGWQVSGQFVACNCGQEGCDGRRFVLNGALLTTPPLKVVLISSPGEGRVWRTLTAADVAGLMPAPAESSAS